MKYSIGIELKNTIKGEYYICDNMQHVLYKLRIIEAQYKDTIERIILTPETEEK